ncbi:MAG: Gfo/Idh/MocA family oxidoreductase [Fimbriimonas sp.]|nr:Gfo/Idh/MocA family oxidoreductase [Fimbriimonas sp.]
MTRFAIVGGGWRTEFFLRIARELPEEFEISGMLVRRSERAEELTRQWGVKTHTTLDTLLADKPDFAVTSLSWDSNPVFLKDLAERGVPVLSETPPAPKVEDMLPLTDLVKAGARIQVAEQYSFQPEHAARLSVIRSGVLGDVFQAQVSVCHGYHGISLIRRFLGIDFQPAKISAYRLPEVVIGGPDRNGRPPKEETTQRQNQLIATLDFGDRQAVFDFVGTMYHSYIRSHRVLVRGTRGEINFDDVRYLADFRTPIEYTLRRVEAGHTGNLDGHFLQGILAGERWAYRNPFPFARLMDDEIAIAACLRGMADYSQGGPDIYSLAEACQDHYLSILMEESANRNEEITSTVQPWAS